MAPEQETAAHLQSPQPDKNPPDNNRIQELSDSEAEYEDMGTATLEEQANIAYLASVRIPLVDDFMTDTARAQDETLAAVLPFLEGNPNGFPLNEFGLPQLQRDKHVQFLQNTMKDYPAPFALMDASRPWLVYWSLQGLTAMGHDITEYKERVVHTFSMAQYPTGGFGGGFGQLPHLAPTYAAVLSLVMVGGDEAYDSINRTALWNYLGNMKQASGGFTMALGGEEDIRGAYCALTVIALLNIPNDLPPNAPARDQGITKFTDRLGEWVSACQSFDGGLSATPGNEAHGAYAFCGLGCLSLMGPPNDTFNTYLDLPLLIHWLSARQCSPEGGYNGRTNKLVDGCYSHWVGGCWALVEAAIPSSDVWNRAALVRYVLSAAQFKKGGLVDKPGKRPDAYHSCYNIAGLSTAQHYYTYENLEDQDTDSALLHAAFHWKLSGRYQGRTGCGEADAVAAIHPVFVVPIQAVRDCREFFEHRLNLQAS